MAEDPQGGGEKSEDASSKKLSKAREEGQVAKSMEVASVFVLLAGVLALYSSGYHLYTNFLAVMSDSFVFNQVPLLNDVEAVHLLFIYVWRIFIMLAPLLAAVFAAAFLSNVVQVGFEMEMPGIPGENVVVPVLIGDVVGLPIESFSATFTSCPFRIASLNFIFINGCCINESSINSSRFSCITYFNRIINICNW